LLNRNAPGDDMPDRHDAAAAPDRGPTKTGGRHRADDAVRAAVSVPSDNTKPQLSGGPPKHRAVIGSTSTARFSDILAIGEFRSIYTASVLSWIGDYAARAAVTALVLHATQSVVAAAAAFAITYAPWVLGGQVLVSLAERYPYRRVMVVCDVARMALMALVAIPGLHLPVVLALLLCSALFSPPFDAARSATLPAVLPGDKYVIAVGLNAASLQPVQITGYLTGSALAAINPRVALLINAGTFAISAVLIRFGVRFREPALTRERRTHLLRETLDGFRLVFGTQGLRFPVVLAFAAAAVAIVPEGLGAPWAAQLRPDEHSGLAQGLIMASVPFGTIVGSLTFSRLIRAHLRPRVLTRLALATPVPLLFAMVGPGLASVVVLAVLTGFGSGGVIPLANAAFVSELPGEYRARAFGVVFGGLQLVQGFAVLLTGALAASAIPIGTAVSAWALAGTLLMLGLVHPWSRSVTAGTPVQAAMPGTMEP
jgi:MFS family permease